ncbi:hypothetical protein [Flavihumibacter petaseus]|uniref:Uncharacterized protein n=1 Tax=Flavihumibacter petaseus NBRC 106054 TaxID=1220578 RepID=A0A0E9N6T3_9BACT|nr:hypothetical protein [Flavihumibacter petaseus]GAO45055.1 hypothetical protein FPE01S_04_02980 [Flavihumibacter petaseus NBRC 106054]
MAYPHPTLIAALRAAADRLREGVYYSWGHHGACNCGQLLQVVTHFSKEEILTGAHTVPGEWTEIAAEYCPVTGTPVELLMKALTDIGMTPTDIHHLEYLSDREVLEALPGGFRWLKRNRREDLEAYLEAFAGLLENRIVLPPAKNTARKAAVLASVE